MSGIGLGLQAAQMEQSRNQQAQELAFRQQQAGINNAQEDRRFEAAQAADVRDFDAMQQWRAFQQQQAERQYQEHAAALERELAGQRASAMVYKAAGAPAQMPQAPGGVGPIPQHPLDTLDDQTLMSARPDALRAYVGAQQDRTAMAQRRQMGVNKVQQARAAGVLKYVSPEQADEFANLGFYSDGTILPDEMPIPLQKQREAQHDALAQLLATSRDANGSMVTDKAMFEHYRAIPMEMAEVAFRQKRTAEAAMQLAQLKGQMSQQAVAQKAAMTGAKTRADAAKRMLDQAEQEYRSVSGQAGKLGQLAPPSATEIESGDAYAKGETWWSRKDATQAKDNTKTQAWRKFQQAQSEFENANRELMTTDAQARGLLDGPNGPDPTDTTPAPDPEAIYRQLESEMPNATDEQLAAELQRRMQGG